MKAPFFSLMVGAMMAHNLVEPSDGDIPNLYSTWRHKKEKTSRMPLTEEETAHLASLSGRPKKAYVKALREKYGE